MSCTISVVTCRSHKGAATANQCPQYWTHFTLHVRQMLAPSQQSLDGMVYQSFTKHHCGMSALSSWWWRARTCLYVLGSWRVEIQSHHQPQHKVTVITNMRCEWLYTYRSIRVVTNFSLSQKWADHCVVIQWSDWRAHGSASLCRDGLMKTKWRQQCKY